MEGKIMPLAVVRGGGDLATGVIYRLWKIGFEVIVLEMNRPTVVRRTVAAAQAVFDGTHTVDGMTTSLIAGKRDVSLLVDPHAASVPDLKPDLLVDAIMAKKNIGTHKNMAARVVALGPGFSAPEDVHAVIETQRGHNLGRVIYHGEAEPNTGIPGEVGGETIRRVIRSPGNGNFHSELSIGDMVQAGQLIGRVEGGAVYAEIGGVLRGLIHPLVTVTTGMKIADIDPRAARKNCFSISDKALAIAGGVLEAALVK